MYDASSSKRNFIATTEFFENIKTKVSSGKKCTIDFSDTEGLTAAAALVMYATLAMAKHLNNYKCSMRLSGRKAVDFLLKSSDLRKLLKNKSIKPNFGSTRGLPIINGVGGTYLNAVVDYIQQRIYNNNLDAKKEHILADAVSETINNVRLHAYPDISNENKHWWLMSHRIGDTLHIAIYDQGTGIPNTIEKKSWSKDKLADEALIALSMEGDVSRTEQKKHGQGSKSIKALVKDSEDGKLWIFSNAGLYVLQQGEKDPLLYALPYKLKGTLIQWNIKVS